MAATPKITVEYALKSESLQMTERDYLRLDIGDIPLFQDIRCVIKDTKNGAESSDDKRLYRSPLAIAMHIGFGSDHTSKE